MALTRPGGQIREFSAAPRLGDDLGTSSRRWCAGQAEGSKVPVGRNGPQDRGAWCRVGEHRRALRAVRQLSFEDLASMTPA